MWSDEITLIHEKTKLNDNGFPETSDCKKKLVYANKKSVGYAEFFQAKQAGFTEQMKFDVFAAEYDDQTIAEHKGKRYRILRSYINPKTNGEYTELTLSDLSERGHNNGL
jgi:SPP1 family predicted phage head-tail adaptor